MWAKAALKKNVPHFSVSLLPFHQYLSLQGPLFLPQLFLGSAFLRKNVCVREPRNTVRLRILKNLRGMTLTVSSNLTDVWVGLRVGGGYPGSSFLNRRAGASFSSLESKEVLGLSLLHWRSNSRPVRVLPKSKNSCCRPQARGTDASKSPTLLLGPKRGGRGGRNRVPPTGKGKAASALRKWQKRSPSYPWPPRNSLEAPPLEKREVLRDPEEGNGSQCSHWRKGTKTM